MGFLSGLGINFGKISSGFKTAISVIGKGFKKAGNTIYHKAIVPTYEKILKPAYTKIIKPVGEKGISFVSHAVDRVERIADAGVKGVEGAGNILSGIGNTPVVLLGALGLGALLIMK
jgi:hypothetical protein